MREHPLQHLLAILLGPRSTLILHPTNDRLVQPLCKKSRLSGSRKTGV